MELRDTSPDARRAYFARLAAMTPAERVAVGVALWEVANSLQRAAMRRRFPDVDETEIRYRIAVTRFGRELADKAFGNKPRTA